MRYLPESLGTLWAGWLITVLFALVGCSHPTQTTPAASRTQSPVPRFTATEAADLAARLANEECQLLYGRRPFLPGQYPARLADDGFRWGGLDVGAPGGLSALVTFAPDGSNPRVEIYYSTDILTPQIQRRLPNRIGDTDGGLNITRP